MPNEALPVTSVAAEISATETPVVNEVSTVSTVVETNPTVQTVQNESSATVEATATKADETVTESKKAKPAKGSSKKQTANQATAAITEPAEQEVSQPNETPADKPQQTEKADKKRPARARKPKSEAKPMDLAATGLQLVETKAEAVVIAVPVEAEKPAKPRRAASWQKPRLLRLPAHTGVW